MMKRIFFAALLLIATIHAQAQFGNFKQLRFVTNNQGDTTATGTNDGRMWYDFSTDEFRVTRAGTNYSLNTGAGGGGGISGLTTGRVPFATSSTTIGDDSNLTWDNTNKLLSIGTSGGLTIFADYNPGTSNRDNLIFSDGMDDFGAVTGVDNFGAGHASLFALTSGSHNLVIGAGAGSVLTSADNNVIVGRIAGATIENGSDNVIIGAYSDVGAASSLNVILGRNNAGPTTGSGAVMIGNDLTIQSSSADDQLTIQNAIFGTGNGGSGTTLSTGNIGLYITTPTARLHLPAGTATANTAPLKIPSGTLLSTEEAGAIESDGDHLYFTDSGDTRHQLDQQGGGSSSHALLGKINVNAAVTGTTAETIAGSFLVSASSVEANDVLRFYIMANKSASVGNTNIKVYVNDTNNLTTPTLIATLTNTAGNIYSSFTRRIFMKNSVSSFDIVDDATALTPDDAFQSTQAIDNISFDLSADFYFIVAFTPSNASDTMTLHGVTLERMR